MILYQVNAFTKADKGGNPAGVVICENGRFPSDEHMQSIAREAGYSETAFIIPGKQELEARYFTPVQEVDLCGHATIAAFKVLYSQGLANAGSDYICRTKAGNIAIKVEKHFISMETSHGRIVSTVKEPNSVNLVYMSLGTEYDPVKIMPACNVFMNLNPMVVDNGLPFLVVPINGVDKLNGLKPNLELVREISKGLNCYGIYAFAFEPKEIGIEAHCRGFYPLLGIDEESATGTGAAALSFYLNGFGFMPAEREACYLQGEAMGRTSELITYIKGSGDDMKILIGGDAVIEQSKEL